MNSKERMKIAMDLKKPDRIPLMCQMSFGHLLLTTGVSPVELLTTADGFEYALLTARQRYKFDGILINMVPLECYDPDWKSRVSRIAKETDGEVIYWKNGDRTYCPWDDVPRLLLKDEKTPDYKDIIDYKLDISICSERYKTVRKIVEKAGSEFSIHSEIASPFSELIFDCGTEKLLMELLDNPEACKEALEKQTEVQLKYVDMQAAEGVDAIVISSAYAGQSLISKDSYKEFVAPCERKIIDKIKSFGIKAYVHTCGFLNDRLEIIADNGYDGIECLDPKPLGNVDIADAKKRIGSRCFIKGNIDSVNMLLMKSKEEVIEDAKYRCEAAGKNGGYILSTACSVAPHVAPENIEVLYDVVNEFKY